jgi:hypothetical protein
LPSWNDGSSKQTIVDFVRATTDRASPTFVPPDERVANFNTQDGALWVEHPMFNETLYCWNRPYNYTDLAYGPMRQLLQYLRDNGYRTYIVMGGGYDYVRVYA